MPDIDPIRFSLTSVTAAELYTATGRPDPVVLASTVDRRYEVPPPRVLSSPANAVPVVATEAASCMTNTSIGRAKPPLAEALIAWSTLSMPARIAGIAGSLTLTL